MDFASDHFNQYVNQISQVGDQFGPMVIKAMVLLIVVLFLVKLLGRFFTMALTKVGVPERKAMMSVTVLHILVLLIAALVVLNMLGFPGMLLFRIIVLVVMCGLAVFIIAKPYIPQLPFKKGDTIGIGKVIGKVEKITFMHTLVRTFDAKVVFIPNHKVLGDQLVNLALKPNRRIDIDFFIGYEQDLVKVKQIVDKLLKDDETVLEKPPPRVVISKFTPDYRYMQARVWVKRTKALTARWAINANIDAAFQEAGIVMASPRVELVARLRQAPPHEEA